MRFFIIGFFFLVSSLGCFSQGTSINTTGAGPAASAGLDVDFTNKGLLVPRMTQAQRNAISLPAASLLIYQTDNTPGYYYNSGTSDTPAWSRLITSASTGWLISGNSGTTASTNFIGTTDAQDLVLKTNNTERIRILSGGNVGIRTTSPNSTLQINGSVSAKTNTVSSDYTIGSTDYFIKVATGDVDRTLTLPTAASSTGRIYVIKKVDSGTGHVVITATGFDLIDATTTFSITAPFSALSVISDGTGWFIMTR